MPGPVLHGSDWVPSEQIAVAVLRAARVNAALPPYQFHAAPPDLDNILNKVFSAPFQRVAQDYSPIYQDITWRLFDRLNYVAPNKD